MGARRRSVLVCKAEHGECGGSVVVCACKTTRGNMWEQCACVGVCKAELVRAVGVCVHEHMVARSSMLVHVCEAEHAGACVA